MLATDTNHLTLVDVRQNPKHVGHERLEVDERVGSSHQDDNTHAELRKVLLVFEILVGSHEDLETFCERTPKQLAIL